jgi:hypothetical protein
VLVVGALFAAQQRAGLGGSTAVTASGFYAFAVQPWLIVSTDYTDYTDFFPEMKGT